MTKAVCPNCGFEPHPDEGPNCTRCNTPLMIQGGIDEKRQNNEQIRVEEPFAEDRNSFDSINLTEEDPLGSQSTAQLLEQQGLEESKTSSSKQGYQEKSENNSGISKTFSNTTPSPVNDQSVKKLSSGEISEIEQELYRSENLASDTDKLAVLSKMTENQAESRSASVLPEKPKVTATQVEDTVVANTPLVEIHPEVRRQRPPMASHITGVAYFAKHLIQITGEQELHDGDSLIIQERKYTLKAKRLSPNLILGIAVALGIILLVVLAISFSPSSDHTGTVIGIALDKSGIPIQQEVTVRFPDLEIETATESNGFFKVTNIPSGSHTIEFVRNGKVLGSDFAAVASGEITTLVLKPTAQSNNNNSGNKRSAVPASTNKRKKTTPAKSSLKTSKTSSKAKPKSSRKSTNRTAKSNAVSKNAKLVLLANVEGAKLVIDGQILGAGNLTYKNISPGTHSYKVSYGGYKTRSGTVKLKSGKSTQLKVTLIPLRTKQETAALQAERLMAEGSSALKAGKLSDANTAFSDAIALEPSNASAYLLRAETNKKLGQPAKTYNDYVRAAEILQSENKFSKANTAYRHAIEIDSKDVRAYVGRGNLYIARNEEIAAVADFETALRLDKRNPAIYIGLGTARYKRGNYKKAIKHFKDARSLDSNNPAAHRGLIKSYFKRDKIKDMKKAYDRFVKSVSATEVSRFRNDPKSAPILRIVDSGN